MSRRCVLSAALLALSCAAQHLQKNYVSPERCQPCHTKIFASYSATGMGRSFAPIDSVPVLEDWSATFTHRASGRVYKVLRRDGGFFLRRTLIGGGGELEKRIHYVVGSGAHSRTYLTRKKNGKLAELPLSWYSANGGYWAMSPGYDRPDHSGFRREVPDSCLFCHNGYPSASNSGIAHGIDCQRCHGPGENHVLRRGPVVNPARLSLDRQAEICLQCHLESASRNIPDSIRRFDRDPYSFRPGEPLGDFTLYFDRASPGPDAVTVNHSAYGLRQSQCFVRSQGALLCTTCHDPHRAVPARDAAKHYTAACRSCHSKVHTDASEQSRQEGCAGCHMSKRRAEDAVHVVITDHWIRRLPPPTDSKPIVEKHGRYSGPVRLYYPPRLADSPLNRVYLALAGLTDSAQLAAAAAKLEAAIAEAQPRHPEFYVELAGALRRTGEREKAARYYSEALRLAAGHIPAVIALSELCLEQGAVAEAADHLEKAGAKTASDPVLLNALAVAYSRASRFQEAEPLLRRALDADDEMPLTWLNLGVCLQAQGKVSQAAASYRQALLLQPDFSRARAYLAQLEPRR